MTNTGYFTHPDCRKHDMGPGHPERPERLDAIEERLLSSGLGQLLQRREAGPAALADIELAHDSRHVKALHR
ncbi:MAG: histone deacetylase family protein, partial [Burkholderiales bacterium]|nr:histone deacetylase family protein [Burkholderiales bacterium]